MNADRAGKERERELGASRTSYAGHGAIAGALATLAFIAVHDILISDIWFATVIMLLAGVLCGLCIGWSYGVVVVRPSSGRWLGYNLLYVVMLMVLGVVSAIVFEPVVSMAALMALNGPPDDLIRQALPMTALFTLAAAVAITLFYRRTWGNFSVILLTTAVIILLLGLNVSVLGLVAIPSGSFYLVAEFLALIVILNVVYVTVFLALDRWSVLASRTSRSSDEIPAAGE